MNKKILDRLIERRSLGLKSFALLIDPDKIKLMQSYARLVAQYADKLGFTPAARARLAKKRSEEPVDGFANEFD